jgi:ankyrin repeat protein
MKKLLVAIRHRDNELVRELISKYPSLVNCQAKQPPKKDDGQSPLQVAFKTRNFEIANFLIDNDADVNFMEQSTVNEWHAPVLHDAIMATIRSSRFMGINGLENTKENFEVVFATLSKLIQRGANVNSLDSYGNTYVMRAVLDASSVLPRNGRPNPELTEDLSRVFALLKESGADFDASNAKRKSVLVEYRNKPVAQFLY